MQRIQARFGGRMARVGFAAATILIVMAASAAFARHWKSATGKTEIDADLVKVENGKVTLRTADGKTLTLDETKFCDDDRDYLKTAAGNDKEAAGKDGESKDADGEEKPAPKNKPKNFSDLSARANACTKADEVLALYKEFLADTSIDENELQTAKNNLPIWESRAAKKAVRFGTRWLEPDEAKQFKEKAADLVKEAVQLIGNKQPDQARDKLREASKVDPESLQANFLAGLMSVFGKRNLTLAKQEFGECVRRQRNHAASLNNLALVEVRMVHYGEAIAHWKAALEAAPSSPEIAQNLGRLVELSEKGVCTVPPSALKQVAELRHGSGFDSHVGWLYMPFDDNGSDSRWIVPENEMHGGSKGKHKWKTGEDPLCMRCGGLGNVKCPNKDCARGTVQGGKKFEAAGTNPQNGQVQGFTSPTRVRCPTCGGTGRVKCAFCNDGIDKNLSGDSGYNKPNPVKKQKQKQPRALPKGANGG